MISLIKTGAFLFVGMFSYTLYAHPPAYCPMDEMSCVREHKRRIENADKILPLLQRIDRLNERMAFVNIEMAVAKAQAESLTSRPGLTNSNAPSQRREISDRLQRLISRQNQAQDNLLTLRAEKKDVWEHLFLVYPSLHSTVFWISNRSDEAN